MSLAPTSLIQMMGALLVFACVLLAPPSYAEVKPVTIRIKIIEAKKTGSFDPKLESFRAALPGFDGAKLLDELETKVEPGGAVSLEILDKKRVLKVTVLEVQKDATVKLKVEIEAFKFSANTTHLRDKATTIVGKMIEKDTGLYLAVTTRLE